MWNSEAVKAYESGKGVMMVKEPHPHYVPIPQRTWVTLTEDEIVLISADCAATHQHTDIHFAKAIEARLKAKNT
jgi:hypothetical protein